MTSWVVLSMNWLEWSVETLRARLDRAFRGEFLPPRERGTFVVEGPIAGFQFLINSTITDAAGTFMLNNVPGPYTEYSDFAAQIGDRELRHLALAQEAWLSIDLIGHAAPHDAYRFIGKALAEIAPADAAVLVDAECNASWRFTDDIRRRLANAAEIA